MHILGFIHSRNSLRAWINKDLYPSFWSPWSWTLFFYLGTPLYEAKPICHYWTWKCKVLIFSASLKCLQAHNLSSAKQTIFFNPHIRICLLTWKREREQNIKWLPSIHTLTWLGFNLQSKHAPWPGLEHTDLWRMGWHPNQVNHWARTKETKFLIRPGDVNN